MARRTPGGSDPSDDLPKKKLSLAAFRELAELYTYAAPYKYKFAASLVFLFLSSLTTLAFPYAIGKLVDSALNGEPQGGWTITNIASGLAVLLVFQSFFSFMRIIWFTEVGEKAVAGLRKDLYARLIRLPAPFFGERRVGELSGRLAADVSQIQDTFTFVLAEVIRSVINLSVGITLILFTSVKLTSAMLASFPVIVVAAVFFGRYIRKLSKEAQDRLADAGVVVEETLQGVLTVKAFGAEAHEQKRYSTAINALVKTTLKGAAYRGAFASFVIFALFGSIIFILYYGSTMVQAGQLTVGELTSFLVYTTFVGASFGSFGEQYSQLQKTAGATERVRELLKEKEEGTAQVPNSYPPIVDAKASGGRGGALRAIENQGPTVRFSNVGFAYPSRPETQIIQDLSFEVGAGERAAVVGPSGAGKSTLVSLLLRFYEPQTGHISFDGQPINQLSLEEVRNTIAVVPQDVFLFGGTIRENLAYGSPNATQKDIEIAAERAYADEFINKLPEGYEAVVGERGVKLSGGQRQRIAVARAILRNPRLLILDEATSSLDAESERYVQAALDELMHGRTSLIIAHRLSTIRTADRILVLENGRLRESGVHDELINRPDGLYRTLARLQFTDGN